MPYEITIQKVQEDGSRVNGIKTIFSQTVEEINILKIIEAVNSVEIDNRRVCEDWRSEMRGNLKPIDEPKVEPIPYFGR